MDVDFSHSIISDNWKKVIDKVNRSAIRCGREPEEINIIAVSKTHSPGTIEVGLDVGIRIFGENYVQELNDKVEYFSGKSIKPKWHFIGHLQRNKVKFIVPYIGMIHTVDSLKLALELSKYAQTLDRNIDILMQINTSGEASKSGCEPNNATELAGEIIGLPNLSLKGLMTIGTFSDDEKIFRREFRLLKKLLDDINRELRLSMNDLSMGMTNDYEFAIEEGASYVRVGTAIFGFR